LVGGSEVRVFTIDFETYYDQEYSLRKMTTEEYVCDPRFEIILVSVAVDDDPPLTFSADTLEEYTGFLRGLGIEDGAVLAHNTMFDGLVLTARLGIYPKLWLDTRSMASAVDKPEHRSVSLENCLNRRPHLGISKGSYVHNMLGVRRRDMSPEQFDAYARYCTIDTIGCRALFRDLLPSIPKEELRVIDLTLRMYLEPQLELDEDLLARIVADEEAKSSIALASIEKILGPEAQNIVRSNDKFAALLTRMGVEVPMKYSLATGKLIPALAKTDEGWAQLCDMYEDHPTIGPLLKVRLSQKSTNVLTRSKRLLAIAQRFKHFRVPLVYYAAHTGRYGGTEKINPQNLKRVDKKAGPLQIRYAVTPPEDHLIITADLAQIEARINAHLSGEDALVHAFATGEDVYSAFASKLFGRTITKADPNERFIGKCCILGLGYGMGAERLRLFLLQSGVRIDTDTAERYVATYRNTYRNIVKMWTIAERMLGSIQRGDMLNYKYLSITPHGIGLPNGMAVKYPNLTYGDTTDSYVAFYDGTVRHLWGGMIVENVVQALARTVIIQQMLAIYNELGLRPAMQVHDELVYVVPHKKAHILAARINTIMSTPPEWAPTLPIAAEVGIGANYGDAK
jgi:DNA polymerase